MNKGKVLKNETVILSNGATRRRVVTDMSDHFRDALEGEFVNMAPLIDFGAVYTFCVSGRSDGKTTSALSEGIKNYVKTGQQIGLIRRNESEIVGTAGENIFNGIVNLDRVREYLGTEEREVINSKGDTVYLPCFDSVSKYGARWFFSFTDMETGRSIKGTEPFCLGFAIGTQAKYKSANWDNIGFIIIDEFISTNGYLPKEDDSTFSLISTIVRKRDDVPIILLGNSIDVYNPYFGFFDMKEAKEMTPGEVLLFESWDYDKYTNKEIYSSKLIYYSDKTRNDAGRKSDTYFFGTNSESALMTTRGEWATGSFPKPKEEVNRDNIKLRFSLIFDGENYDGLVVKGVDGAFLYFRRAVGGVPPEVFTGKQALFTLEPDNRANVFYDLYTKHPRISIVGRLISENRVFFEDNTCGNAVRSYLLEMRNVSV